MEDRPYDGSRNGARQRRPIESFAKLYERPLPYSLEAEMALLGSLILDPKVTADVVLVLDSGNDFYSEAHAAIYQALIDVYDKTPDADLIAILDVLRDRGKLDDIGGADYLAKLANETPSAVGAPRYAKTVADKAKLRRLIEAADRMIYDSLNSGDFGVDAAREIIDSAESSVFEIAQENQRADIQPLSELLDAELKRIEASEGRGLSGLRTGFVDLDNVLSGLQPGEMIVLAARPSMGKTALALNMAEQVARGGRVPGDQPHGSMIPVGIFSLEMSKSSLVVRLLSAASSVDSHRMRTGHLNAQELSTLRSVAEELEQTPIFLDDTPGLSVLALRARARRMVASHGVRALFVDYLQLLSAPGSARESRQVEVSAISRGLKALARELNVPVVCLSQLNRASEQREGNRPRMSDLRESGSIEQDADVVVLLHREDYYHKGEAAWEPGSDEFDPRNEEKIGVAELIIAKQRNGPTDIVKLTWDRHTTRFKNYAASSNPWDASTGARGGASSFPRHESPEPKPFTERATSSSPPRAGFPIGPKTGPVADHRDGGGPDRDEDEGGIPPF